MNICEAHSWCCCCGEIWSKRVLPLRRKFVKEKEGPWRRRIYRKYASCKWLKDAGLEFTRADVVVSISRGPPGQWFPETEHWASAIFVGTSGIPPKIIYRSVKSYRVFGRTRPEFKPRSSWLFANTLTIMSKEMALSFSRSTWRLVRLDGLIAQSAGAVEYTDCTSAEG